MAVISSTEIDIKGARTFRIALFDGTTCRRTFRVRTNSAADTEPTVFAQAQSAGPNPVPNPLTLFPGSTISFSYQYDVIRDQNSRIDWLVTVDYKTIFGQIELDRNSNPDPTQRPCRISAQSRTVMVPRRSAMRCGPYNQWGQNPGGGIAAPFTSGGAPMFAMKTAANSATDPLDPPIMIPQTEWELHCIKNVNVLPTWIQTYNNGINIADQAITIEGQQWTIPAGQGKLGNLVFSDHMQENAIGFREISWNVTTRILRPKNLSETSVPSPWDEEILDMGMRTRARTGSSSSSSSSVGSTGWQGIKYIGQSSYIVTPIPFNGLGQPISADGSAIPENALMRYCYRTFQTVDYSIMPWS